ncbi:MAG TPA: FAD-dependent oxidoreductase, partial [Polyangiaceae bacterium]|nr:FAD-dependent oxidoreductase [Polyangiaceae bacterium]
MASLAMNGLSRREFVAGVLGAAALQHCRAAPPPLPPGELLLPGKAAGHRLRDGGLEVARPARFETARVVVVGGGAAGLAAAWWLARAGWRDVVVLELDDALGGTARSGASAVSAYPWGAHYIVAPLPENTQLVALLEEMGALEPGVAPPTVAEVAACREPEERIFHLGRWYSGLYLHAGASSDDQAQLQRFQAAIGRWVGFRDARGRRAFALPSSAGSDAPEVSALDRESFGGWLDRQGFDSPRLRWLADYACRDDYGLLAADTSAWAGIGYFAARIAKPGDDAQPVVTWPAGNGRIMQHFASRIGAGLRLRHAVSSVTPTDAGVDVIAQSEAGAVGFHAERVIVAAPSFVQRRIVAGLERARPARPSIDRGAWAVANLHLSERPRARPEDAPLAWDNVIYDSRSLGYVVATHQSGRDHGPTVLTWYYPFTGEGAAARRSLDGATREDWAEVALADIERAHPDIRGLCQRVDVAYWGH